MPNTYLKLGEWNALCDICKFKFKSSKLKLNWKGQRVCEDDWEPRNQQDFIKVRAELGSAPWKRPRTGDNFIRTCDIWSSSPMADFGTADCATVGGNTNIPLLLTLFDCNAVAGYAIAGYAIPGVSHV